MMYKISVPATTANIGPGFDSFGLALNIYNHFFMDFHDKLLFENCDLKDCKNNLVYTSAMNIFRRYYGDKNYSRGLHLKFDTKIPLSRGLGSSATCIVAGVLGANLLLGEPYSKDELFKIAVEIEGHPDNISPAFYGGLNISSTQEKGIFRKKVRVSDVYRFYILIPQFKLSTSKARFVLPHKVDFRDAVSNISNATLMVLSLMDGDTELLQSVSNDKLHEPYRKYLIPGFDKIKAQALYNGALGCFLSGAGPSLLCIVENTQSFLPQMNQFLNNYQDKWLIKQVQVDNQGVTWTKI